MSPASKTPLLRPDIRWALCHYPFALLAAGLAALWWLADEFAWSLVQDTALGDPHVPAGLALAFLLATAADFAAARTGSPIRLAAQALGFLSGSALGFLVEPDDALILPLLGAAFTVLFTAGIATGQGPRGFWLANARLGAGLAAGIAGTGIVTVGTFTILAALEHLFGLDTDWLVKSISIMAWAFALPLFCLSVARFDDLDPDAPQDNMLFQAASIATDVLLIPLMLAFAAILHLYAAQIALMGELPKGQIGWIAPAYLTSGYSVFVLAHDPEIRFPRLRSLFLRFWVPGTLVPLGLLGLAVATRIRAYGITEDRYGLAAMVACGAILAASALIRRPFDIRLVPLIAGLAAFLLAFGPFSAKNMAIESQTARARAILASVPPERWAAEEDGGLSDRQKEDLLSAVEYLRFLTSPELRTLAADWPPALPKDLAELRNRLSTQKPATTPFRIFRGNGVTRLGPMTWIDARNMHWQGGEGTVGSGDLSYTLRLRGFFLEVSGEGRTTRFDLSPLLTADRSTPMNPQRFTLGSVEGREGYLMVEAFVRVDRPGNAALNWVEGSILLR